MTNEYACPRRNECGLYLNENPDFSGEKALFRGLNILDSHYRVAACEGASGIPCFGGCEHYKLLTNRDDLGLSESFPGPQGVDANDVNEDEKGVNLESMSQVITTEDGCGGNSSPESKSDSGKRGVSPLHFLGLDR